MSAALLGAVCGATLSGRLTDLRGRKRTIFGTACLFGVGSILCAVAPSPVILIAGRIAVGLAIGVASYTAPLYIGEIAPPKLRGGLVTLNQLAITVGILLAYVVDATFAPSGNWRWMFGFGLFPVLALGCGIAFLPESPRWLLLHRHKEEALKVLSRIRSSSEAAGITAEVNEILEHAESGHGKLSDLFTPMVMPVLLLGITLAVIQQITGINTVIYYAPTIFQQAGFQSAQGSIIATAGVGLVNVLMTVVSIPLLDRVGRRPLLLASLGGMALSLAALGLGFAVGGVARRAWLSIVALSGTTLATSCSRSFRSRNARKTGAAIAFNSTRSSAKKSISSKVVPCSWRVSVRFWQSPSISTGSGVSSGSSTSTNCKPISMIATSCSKLQAGIVSADCKTRFSSQYRTDELGPKKN